jgi:hypothetical protein
LQHTRAIAAFSAPVREFCLAYAARTNVNMSDRKSIKSTHEFDGAFYFGYPPVK